MSLENPTKSLLVELFVEELPPKALKKLGEAFAQGLFDALKAQGLTGEHSALTSFASPRRLAAHVSAVLGSAPDKQVSLKLMPVSVALTADGQPTPALLKKLASVGADVSVLPQLKRQPDSKAEALFYDSLVPGVMLAVGLQKALDEAIAKLPIPKLMTYQPDSGALPGWSNVAFVRPAHGLVALHGAEVVPVTVLGLQSRRETHGHRFEAQMDPVVLQHADHYAQQLREQGAVIASFAERHGEIVRQLARAAAAEGLVPINDAGLLDEVTALVERPNVLLGRFDENFLKVPPECLILTMKANQKYFPLLDVSHDRAGRLTNKFLIVSNITPDDPSRVVEGNERVVRPRLADAKFFFDQDKKKTLASRVGALVSVVYHTKLGSQAERLWRVRAIAKEIGLRVGGVPLQEQADLTARLMKTDLLTDMVGEFPELQGTMGRYYAQHDGFDDEIAFAIEDHYRPRFSGDDLPRTQLGLVVAIADKLETLVGLFAIGQQPTGDKDPFALRRQAIGLIRIVIERALPLRLDEMLQLCRVPFASGGMDKESGAYSEEQRRLRGTGSSATFGFARTVSDEAIDHLTEFINDRLASYLRERGYGLKEVEAVLAVSSQKLADVIPRLEAVRQFLELPEAIALAAANKRVANILKKADQPVEASIGDAVLIEPAEVTLALRLRQVKPLADDAFERGDYADSLLTLAALKPDVDAFFDGVMVNVADPLLRSVRLNLLATLHATMNRVADLSKLAA